MVENKILLTAGLSTPRSEAGNHSNPVPWCSSPDHFLISSFPKFLPLLSGSNVIFYICLAQWIHQGQNIMYKMLSLNLFMPSLPSQLPSGSIRARQILVRAGRKELTNIIISLKGCLELFGC